MSSDPGEVHEIPTTSIPQSPPPTHVHLLSISSPSSNLPSSLVSVNLNAASLLITPPKLTRCPLIALTRIDAVKSKISITSPIQLEIPLPPPPPLIKMPISTRKEKRGTTSKSSVESEEERPQEPPRKRTRTGNSESEIVPPARKIIQEIFGPDKSKRPKGRKRRRGPTTPKKKSPVKQEQQVHDDIEDFDLKQEEEQNEDEDEPEHESEAINKNDGELEEQHDKDDKVQQQQESNVEIKEEQINETVKIEAQSDEIEIEYESVVLDNQTKVEGESDDNESKHEDDSDSTTSITRMRIGRNAKRVANEKLKNISQQNETGKGIEVEPVEPVVKEEEEEEKSGEIRSRRSTFEGSSKSSGSIAQAESESSSKPSYYIDPQRNSPTPMSVISEDDDRDLKEDLGEIVSVSDILDQKDSDVDSTYSWKPVRAAAAFAMEQVTKKQGGSGSVVLGEGESKTFAAAERRARKIQRYKGRNRRTLLFKSSNSKQYTTTKKRWSAQPTIIPKIFHHGSYFQAGDIVFVEMEGDVLIHGQISGIMMDHYGEISAGIRWLAPTCSIYPLVDFDPKNYGIRYDIPEKLMKIEYINFVMHLSPDYFRGHPSFGKIEKNSIYSRFGRSIHTCTNEYDSDRSSNNEESKNINADISSESDNERKIKNVKINKPEEDEESDASEDHTTKDRKRLFDIPHGSSSDSTDVEDDEDDGVAKSSTIEESSKDIKGQNLESREDIKTPQKRHTMECNAMDVDEEAETFMNSKEVAIESGESDTEIQ